MGSSRVVSAMRMLRGEALDRCAVLGAKLAALAIQVMGTVIPENAFLESKLKN